MPLKVTSIWSLALLLGCSVVDGGDRAFADEGRVCLSSTETGSLRIAVIFPGCLSSSCDRVSEATCSLVRSGSELRLRSSAEIERTGARVCTDDCGEIRATCESEPIEAGDYVLSHGSDSTEMTLPSTGSTLFGATAAECAR